MALQQDYTDDSHHVGNYWRIISYANYINDGILTVTVGVYKDKAASDAKASPMKEFPIRLVGEDYTDNMSPANLNGANKNPRVNLYPWLKSNFQAHTDIDLSGAADVDPD